MPEYPEQQRPKMYRIILKSDLDQSQPIDPNDFISQSQSTKSTPVTVLISKKNSEETFKILEKKGLIHLPGKSTAYDDKNFPSSSLHKYNDLHFIDEKNKDAYLDVLNQQTDQELFRRIEIQIPFEIYIQDAELGDKANYTYLDIIQFQKLIPILETAIKKIQVDTKINNEYQLTTLNEHKEKIDNLKIHLENDKETNKINELYPELESLRTNCIKLLGEFIATCPQKAKGEFTELYNIGKVDSFTGKYLYPDMNKAIESLLININSQSNPSQEKPDAVSLLSTPLSQTSDSENKNNFSSSFEPLLNRINSYGSFLNEKNGTLAKEKAAKLSSLSEQLTSFIQGGENQTKNLEELKGQINESKETLSQYRDTALKNLFWCCFSAFRPKTTSARLLEKLEEHMNKCDFSSLSVSSR